MPDSAPPSTRHPRDSPNVYAAGADPSAIVATSQYVYAVNTGGRSVSVYRFDTQNDTGFGTLTPVVGSPFLTAGSPNGLVIDPTATHVYTTESQPNEVSGFSIDATNGSLTPIPGSPFAASYAIRSPVMDAGGKRLHAERHRRRLLPGRQHHRRFNGDWIVLHERTRHRPGAGWSRQLPLCAGQCRQPG